METKKEVLLSWIKSKGIVSSAEIYDWGAENYFISAGRCVRRMVNEGLLNKIEGENLFDLGIRASYGMNINIAYYEAL